jgi:glycosyltransferase involved in cell wall biosynthesis
LTRSTLVDSGREQRGPIRVAFLTPNLQTGGAERQMAILAGALPSDRFTVRFLCMSERGPLAAEVEALGIQVDVLGIRGSCMPLHPSCLVATVRAVRRYLALTAEVDIVDAWLRPAMTFAAVVQPVARVPILMGGRRSLGDQYRSKPWYRRAGASIAARRMDALVTNSRIAATEAVQEDRVRPSRVHVVPNAVLPPVAHPEDRLRYRSSWGFGDDHLVVGSVANYKPAKRLDMLLDVADDLRERLPGLRYVLVGDGPLRGHLESKIRRLDLGSLVRLHGTEPDARRVYSSFDILAQTSETEGLPNVILESAAEGLPIVATMAGGTTEILTDGKDSLLVQIGDTAGMAGAIVRIAEDGALRERLGAAARRRATDYSPDRLVDATAAIYRDLARRAGRLDG